jgi:hypothetical protein
MKNANRYFVALLVGLSAAAFGSPASAQESAARDAAIRKCTAQAHQESPNDDPGEHKNRMRLYAACMVDLGFEP